MHERIAHILERDTSALIPPDLINEARAAGLLIHHEFESREWVDSEGEVVEEILRDDIYAATPGFVRRYYASGGTWEYS